MYNTVIKKIGLTGALRGSLGVSGVSGVLVVLVVLGALGACSPADTPRQPAAAPAPEVTTTKSSAPVLSMQGYGPVSFGMTQQAAQSAAQAAADPAVAPDPACSTLRFASLPGVRFMLEQGIVTRADAEPGVANKLGVKVGDPAAQVREKHPALVVTPHKYDPAGHYLTLGSDDQQAALILEDDGNRITDIRAGRQPAVAYVEGCL